MFDDFDLANIECIKSSHEFATNAEAVKYALSVAGRASRDISDVHMKNRNLMDELERMRSKLVRYQEQELRNA